jgi:type II secretory pathway predicted ATPase ExeA
VFAGHPKLTNDLRRPSMEEIGSRTQGWSVEPEWQEAALLDGPKRCGKMAKAQFSALE